MKRSIGILFLWMTGVVSLLAEGSDVLDSPQDSVVNAPVVAVPDVWTVVDVDSSFSVMGDSASERRSAASSKRSREQKVAFAPDPKRATWYAIVCPGLGQIYNRSYWKLPILYGGVVALSYLITWNAGMYNDYSNAYHDIMDNDPRTNSYMALYPSYDGTQSWLTTALQRKKDYYRRVRDISTFGMVGLYLVSVIDAFVDAHLYDFAVSDDLSLRVEPVVNGFLADREPQSTPMMVGLQCSFRFK